MKKFLAIYVGTQAGLDRAQWNQRDAQSQKSVQAKGIAAWGEWGAVHGAALVDRGSPLGKTKRIDSGGISDIRNEMVGYAVVEAASHEAAAKLFENHPHFTILPGDSVEIMECLPLPGQ
jgi:hypothetical protein